MASGIRDDLCFMDWRKGGSPKSSAATFPHQSDPDGLWHPRRPLFYGLARSWLPLNLQRVSISPPKGITFEQVVQHPFCLQRCLRALSSLSRSPPLFMNANGFGKEVDFSETYASEEEVFDGESLVRFPASLNLLPMFIDANEFEKEEDFSETYASEEEAF
ncbi:hypothetical protein CEXT_305441 [Caerostris extrusa]|uniref:AGC-kinase C-terminal domain-containing protein n=1 Tax=Caerostris extrusa TaxID=172846 RepID=A0AAV4P8Z6_CAEEX|nr:hypothetical protein CEXT_305441 [Caerostris extrusa]